MNAGDIVKLKGQVILMTVINKNNIGWVTCTWFDGEAHICEKSFPESALEIIVPPVETLHKPTDKPTGIPLNWHSIYNV